MRLRRSFNVLHGLQRCDIGCLWPLYRLRVSLSLVFLLLFPFETDILYIANIMPSKAIFEAGVSSQLSQAISSCSSMYVHTSFLQQKERSIALIVTLIIIVGWVIRA